MRDVEIPKWLQGLPFAPEFRPTDTEFADPIAYISKIEKEASAYGICKIIPPFPKPSKRFVLANLNKSLLKCPELGDDVGSLSSGVKASKGESRAVFTTRQQELGLREKKGKGGLGGQPQLPSAHKQVWQSGEIYTLEQFESKSKTFAKSQLSTVKDVSPLVIETLFWKASHEKPIYIEYANDVPGSGFGEPEEASRCFRRCRRSRKRGTFIRNSQECSDFNKYQVYKMSNSYENKDEPDKKNPDSSVEISKASTSSSNAILDQMSMLPKQKVSDAGNEMEGTSGWKLSNSPWNLQVIARSPGSLTRFMPDDIPGVTSPMIYIGMLFSWFAWHVEDHELHSLNFLHNGSQKTWYSIPGDYAFTFEEVIRTQAYGGNIDRLAALTLLGEKTTLLSPEVVVASGIPCCRLVQNPGEFVVTFPRAYHIGFSHGFNCGEAANFGTPKWLTIAKEAAVRRAAMNHLPMLSHQQLLYLLTMSFISRVPRSLLPGVRSSRLRDRQKDERELSVKKAFVEDILKENKLLTTLLGKSFSYHAVLWDLESLASSDKESNLWGRINADINPTPTKDVHSENDTMKDPCREMNLYAELMDDPYVGDDDMSSDFQVDSGTLPCVACGVLGFPFMAIVQPYETAFLDTVTTNDHVVQDLGVQSPMESHFLEGSVSEGLGVPNKNLREKVCSDHQNGTSLITESTQTTFSCGKGQILVSDISPPFKDSPYSTEVKCIEGWNTSSPYLRPCIFCLEHARQTKELLHSKGGAKVLVICHSDFQKVKAHAAAIAEQIGSPFSYNEIPLEKASRDDLNLVNLAIGNEEQGKCEEDWTTELNINLQQCVKLGNKSSSEKVQHALTLDGLFADTAPCADSPTLDWKARKTRSRRKVNNVDRQKSSKSITVHKGEVLAEKSDIHVAIKGGCLIQYSRKRFFKSKLRGSASELGKWATEGNSSSELGMLEKSDVHVSGNSFPSQDANSFFTLPPMVENVEERTSGDKLVEMGVESEKSAKSSVDEAGLGCFDEKTEERNIDCIDENENETENFDGSTENEHETENFDGSTENELIPSNVTSVNGPTAEETYTSGEECSLRDQISSEAHPKSTSKSRSRNGSKRKREVDLQIEEQFGIDGFIRSPCEGLRSRGGKNSSIEEKKPPAKKVKKPATGDSLISKNKKNVRSGSHKGDTEGFKTALKRNKCPYKGCGKKFRSYKYAMIHLRVHEDERPLKCSWKGCKMTFKWAWARTEHLRVHTGERPYKCKVDGCGLTFRFVSDYSRHRRKTGHYVDQSN